MSDSAPGPSAAASERAAVIAAHLSPAARHADGSDDHADGVRTNDVRGRESLTVRDNRTGKTFEIPISNGTIPAKALQKIRRAQDKVGLRVYDPGYVNTANCTSRICYIDGQSGTLLYRGYPIEQLAEKSSFLEVAYLLIYGELPNQPELSHWVNLIMRHTFVHENMSELFKSFRYDAHPMGMVVSGLAAMSTFHPEANPALQGQTLYKNERVRNKQIHRILGKMPTLAAMAYRHRVGRPYNKPVNHLNYAENFIYMLDYLSEENYRPNPKLARALDVLFILHAEHELNCSTAAMRHLSSSGVDVFTAASGAAGALYGPSHGGANEAVVRMLEKIGSADNIDAFIEDVKAKKTRLMGFGHRVYKNYDPRARIVKKIAYEVFDIVGKDPLIEIAVALERRALSDEYFVSRRLYPNVDFYSGIIYRSCGFPTDFFPVLFAIPRMAGWLAHWREFQDDPENRIVRPRQVYKGEGKRTYVPLAQRGGGAGGVGGAATTRMSVMSSRRMMLRE